jgi:hypothetical protein
MIVQYIAAADFCLVKVRLAGCCVVRYFHIFVDFRSPDSLLRCHLGLLLLLLETLLGHLIQIET